MFSLLETLSPAMGWVAVVIACLVGAFVVYVGATLGVTLFHPRAEVRRHAARVLRQLLAFLRSSR
ncbi:hypothetical protein JIG36_37895 [Actinoplanes sp. LDG1-06]|uniref:Uncharacterized protein n=1 Tax=Paractinoplanes ovalisporus TaxID=2810368 RepID=A0ABS2AN69_9ACTN|nr:hypothetical protein [Actinoplanes ovalisporus]MBM2621292.1 hypothetical protein [Actinoplanes ovalisporus]